MVATVQELEACIGAAAMPAKLKAIDHLDAHAAQWIAAAPLMTLAAAGDDCRVRVTLGGGDPGFAKAEGAHKLTVARAALDRSDTFAPGQGASCLFVVPGITETFRVAGRIAEVTPAQITIEASECFVHCGKALIRSAFWEGPAQTPSPKLPAAARFCVLATADAGGNVDTSPKGDPVDFLVQIDERTLALPDRLGNRRADGHRNILANDRVALIAFAPGGIEAYEVTGRARLSRVGELLARMKVEDKAPLLATLIAIDEARTYESPALRRARAWDADRVSPSRPSPAATLATHIKLSQARLKAEPFDITPESVEKALATGYKTTLY
jgi:uncharacterized protein